MASTLDELDDYGIVDAHHHLWIANSPLRPNFLPVMQKELLPSFGSMEHNDKDYLVEDILKDYKDAGVKLEASGGFLAELRIQVLDLDPFALV